MKRDSTKNIIAAIHDVLAGKLHLSQQMTELFAKKFVHGQPSTGISPLEQLSDRELEVFNLFGQGFETRRVTETLHVSLKTIQSYCARIKTKLNLANAAELIREAVYWHEVGKSSSAEDAGTV
jgi:DNA-binding NarL/FixJ family response regulator